MSHGNAYLHLFESAKENTVMTIRQCMTCGWDLAEDEEGPLCGQCVLQRLDWPREDPAIMSNFVKRNLDGAQYPQPRGSQYEG